MKGSPERGGIWSAKGEGEIVGDLGGGVGNSLRSGASWTEMYVDSSMTMGVGETLQAMSEVNRWQFGVSSPSFYLPRDGACDILRLIEG